jgi:indolepyruvate ferredoxin oxidoreductase, alpha subunit
MLLFDPRPALGHIVDMVEHAFAMSEASNMPAMMELRIRACHVQGEFVARDNRAAKLSMRAPIEAPPQFNYGRLSHPPATFAQEKLKSDVRLPAARAYLRAHALNEHFGDASQPVGLIIQGGLMNTLDRALTQLGLVDATGAPRWRVLCLNLVYPLDPQEIAGFCRACSAVLVVEEGQPEYIEHEVSAVLRREGVSTALYGKDLLPQAGELTAEAMLRGLLSFARKVSNVDGAPSTDLASAARLLDGIDSRRAQFAREVGHVPPRPPTFCVGCPERPVFSAMKLLQREIGPVHVSTDIGCHALATFEPFSMGNSILGYGMSLAAAAGVDGLSAKRPIAIMGDGGFWHNGLLTGVQSTLFNGGDGVLVVLKNGYTSATGTQELISSPGETAKLASGAQSAVAADQTIEAALQGVGVKWLKTVNTYDVAKMLGTLKEAFATPTTGLKVIVGEGECQLERQRRWKPLFNSKLTKGEPVTRVRFGVDEATCSGDHSCIRLSGCPSLTLKTSSDPFKTSPVVEVNNGCVGCGLCGSVAHAATLCPSFYRIETLHNASALQRFWWRMRERVVAWLRLPEAA